MRVVGSNDWQYVSLILVHLESDGDVLLAITTKKPRAKIPATPSFCFSFICSLETMVMGRQMMNTSVAMLKQMVIQ